MREVVQKMVQSKDQIAAACGEDDVDADLRVGDYTDPDHDLDVDSFRETEEDEG